MASGSVNFFYVGGMAWKMAKSPVRKAAVSCDERSKEH